MKKCPACHHEVDLFAVECDSCGVIFAKWEALHSAANAPVSGDPASAPSPADPGTEKGVPIPPDGLPPDETPTSEKIIDETVKAASGKGLYVLIGLLALTIVGGGIWLFSGPPPGGAGSSASSGSVSFGGPCPGLGRGDEFEREVPVPGEPQGLAWGDGEFVFGNRVKPWGFVRVGCDGSTRRVPVLDPIQKQNVNFWCLTYNGAEYVSVTDGRWVGAASPDAFLVHDPQSLEILRHFPAPPKIGGLAWDGSNYWAGTRKNTAEEAGESWLYKLDDRFNIVQQWPAPLGGCQGLCWANGILFWVDVFTEQVVLYRVEGSNLVKLHALEDASPLLSGIVFDGDSLWFSEYQKNRLRMIPKRVTDAWFAGDYRVGYLQIARIARQLRAFEQGDSRALDTILSLKSRGIPNAEEIHRACNALDSLGMRPALLKAIDAILADPAQADLHPLLAAEKARWTEGGVLPAVTAPLAAAPVVTPTLEASPTLTAPPAP